MSHVIRDYLLYVYPNQSSGLGEIYKARLQVEYHWGCLATTNLVPDSVVDNTMFVELAALLFNCG